MRERKQYPDLSDEELDKRAEETLRRMLEAPPKPQVQPQQNSHNKQRRKKRHR
jgi:hypothetical protein